MRAEGDWAFKRVFLANVFGGNPGLHRGGMQMRSAVPRQRRRLRQMQWTRWGLPCNTKNYVQKSVFPSTMNQRLPTEIGKWFKAPKFPALSDDQTNNDGCSSFGF
eukprot:4369425-Amphidinium_carterae.1